MNKVFGLSFERNAFDKDLGMKLYERFVSLDNYSIKRDSFETMLQIIDNHAELSKLFDMSCEQIHWCENEWCPLIKNEVVRKE